MFRFFQIDHPTQKTDPRVAVPVATISTIWTIESASIVTTIGVDSARLTGQIRLAQSYTLAAAILTRDCDD